MNNHTLYLIQSDYNNTVNALNTLNDVYASQDAVVLMGESVLLADTFLATVEKLYILETEAENLASQNSKFEVINYTQFAELCLQYKRSVRLK